MRSVSGMGIPYLTTGLEIIIPEAVVNGIHAGWGEYQLDGNDCPEVDGKKDGKA